MSETPERPLIVRCIDRRTFEVDRKTLDAKHTSVYDAYCFSDPSPDVDYISKWEWDLMTVEKMNAEMGLKKPATFSHFFEETDRGV